jgi:hypothetical protein
MTSPSQAEICHVCTRVLEAHMRGVCDNCGKLYHLNSRADLPGIDCGQVWINEEHLGLEFVCNVCLNPAPPPGELDDILDLAEAAALANLPESDLARAAQLGHIKHRKTSSGVLLFSRGDVLSFAVAH